MSTFGRDNKYLLMGFTYLFVFLSSVATRAAAVCDMTASDVWSLRKNLVMQVESVKADTTQMVVDGRIEGAINCLHNLKIELDVDPLSTRALSSRPTTGAILDVRADVQGSRFQIFISASSVALGRLFLHFQKTKTLEPFIKAPILVSFIANYGARVEVTGPTEIANLSQRYDCQPQAKSKMFCEDHESLEYQAIPVCLRDPILRARYTKSFQTSDVFLNNPTIGAQIKAVDRNLCYFQSQNQDWILAAASDIFQQLPEAGEPLFIRALSLIKVSGDLRW